jgi:hypothetical protein
VDPAFRDTPLDTQKERTAMNLDRTARFLAATLVAAAASHTSSANLLSNPGFEISAFTGAGNVLNNFTGFQGVWGIEMGSITGPIIGVTPASGGQMLEMTDDFISYTQTFQAVDVSSYAALINAGNAQVNASALFNTNGGYIGAFSLVNVSFFSSSVYSSLLGNSGNGTLNLDGNPLSWETASVSAAIPVNTTWVVFQVAYQNASLAGNTGFVDDTYLDIRAVPAPGALALLGLAGLVGRRRR